MYNCYAPQTLKTNFNLIPFSLSTLQHFLLYLKTIFFSVSDVQVMCSKAGYQYIPPVWVMCLESVAHLLVMLNFSTNFLVYCSVSNQFKAALSKVVIRIRKFCLIFCEASDPSPGNRNDVLLLRSRNFKYFIM